MKYKAIFSSDDWPMLSTNFENSSVHAHLSY